MINRRNRKKRRKEQNSLEQDAALDIRQKNLETEIKILNLDKESGMQD